MGLQLRLQRMPPTSHARRRVRPAALADQKAQGATKRLDRDQAGPSGDGGNTRDAVRAGAARRAHSNGLRGRRLRLRHHRQRAQG